MSNSLQLFFVKLSTCQAIFCQAAKFPSCFCIQSCILSTFILSTYQAVLLMIMMMISDPAMPSCHDVILLQCRSSCCPSWCQSDICYKMLFKFKLNLSLKPSLWSLKFTIFSGAMQTMQATSALPHLQVIWPRRPRRWTFCHIIGKSIIHYTMIKTACASKPRHQGGQIWSDLHLKSSLHPITSSHLTRHDIDHFRSIFLRKMSIVCRKKWNCQW